MSALVMFVREASICGAEVPGCWAEHPARPASVGLAAKSYAASALEATLSRAAPIARRRARGCMARLAAGLASRKK